MNQKCFKPHTLINRRLPWCLQIVQVCELTTVPKTCSQKYTEKGALVLETYSTSVLYPFTKKRQHCTVAQEYFFCYFFKTFSSRTQKKSIQVSERNKAAEENSCLLKYVQILFPFFTLLLQKQYLSLTLFTLYSTDIVAEEAVVRKRRIKEQKKGLGLQAGFF